MHNRIYYARLKIFQKSFLKFIEVSMAAIAIALLIRSCFFRDIN